MSAEGTITLEEPQGMPLGKISQNYSQMYAMLVLSATAFKLIMV